MASTLTIRAAESKDVSQILTFIKELAIYEKAEDEVEATPDDIQKTLFDDGATAHALICEYDDKPVGFAVYFYNYSTWRGQNGLYLEDLFVSAEYRGIGAGKALLQYMAKLAVENNCGRFEWSVLDWNTPAIEFYESLGAKAKREWLGYRLDGAALDNFAKADLS